MKRSISLTGQPVFLTAGRAGFRGGSNAQCVDHARPLLDPAAQHRDLVGGQLLAALLGGHAQLGIVALDPEDRARSHPACPARSPAPPLLSLANAPSLVSSRRPALRALSSGPWQAKQLSERIGRTSRAKLTGRDERAFGAVEALGVSEASPRSDRAAEYQACQHDSQRRCHSFTRRESRSGIRWLEVGGRLAGGAFPRWGSTEPTLIIRQA